MTSQQFQTTLFEESEILTLSVEDFHAKLSQSLESEEVSKILGELSFLKLHASHLFSDLAIYSLRTSKDYLTTKGGATFETILRTLDELGYDAEWDCLNSKEYVPQNRERIFIIGHLRGGRTRKVFPFEKAYCETTPGGIITGTLTTRYPGAQREGTYIATSREEKGIKVVGKIEPNFNQSGCIYDPVGIAPTLRTMQGGGLEPKIKIKEATTRGYVEATPGDSVNISHPNSETRRGRVGKGIANTLLTGEEQAVVTEGYRIRKLTPRECWRLQGFPDCAFDRAKEVNSDSQLYKQAGNSVTVNVIEDIARRLV